MNDILDYDDFRFMPVGMLQASLVLAAVSSEDKAMDQDAIDLLSAEYTEGVVEGNSLSELTSMQGFWPPTDAQLNRVHDVMQMLRDVEQTTGVSFQRRVGVSPPHSGMYAVQDTGHITLDCNALTGGSPNLATLKNIVLHEAGHIHYGDTKRSSVLEIATEMMKPLQAISDLHTRDATLFYDVVSKAFPNVEAFEHALHDAQADIDAFMSSFDTMERPMDTWQANDILDDMYGDKIVERPFDALDKRPEALSFKHIMTLAEAFPFHTDNDIARRRALELAMTDEMREQTMTIDEQCALNADFATGRDAKFIPSDEDKAHINELLTGGVAEQCRQRKTITSFARQLSIAAEFRADDYSVMLSDRPAEVASMLHDVNEMLKHNDVLNASAAPTLNEHPDSFVREHRARIVARMTESLGDDVPVDERFSVLKTGSYTAKELTREMEKLATEMAL